MATPSPVSSGTRPFGATRLVLALVAAGIVGGAGATFVAGASSHAAPGFASTVAAGTTAGAPGGAAALATPDFAQIARRYGPAVVNISTSGMRKAAAAGDDDASPADGDDGLPEFFRRFQGPLPPSQPMRGQGSGFIVGADGIVLTNAHVVRDASVVTVKLTDRREFEAKVLGSDPKTDVAVLKIDATGLPTVPIGSTRDLEVGQWVLAIGAPFGFENSVTAGVVSAKGRSLPQDSTVPFIQTDVAVNPGNSGGPLFNARGEVVGINSQIYSRSGGYQGLSFAIPIDVATRVKDQIVATGKASHARLGVTVQEVNQTLADSFRLDRPEGALVSAVEPGSPADKAGLKTGDVVRKVDGEPVVASGDLPALVGALAPGKSVALEIWRGGRRETLTATLGNAADRTERLARGDAAAGKGRLGLSLRPLAPEERRAAGAEGGLVVEGVAGPSALAGVQPGDLLVGVDGKPVQSVEQVRDAVASSGKSVALLIERGGNRLFVPVRVG
jgi:serine protease Do